MNEKKIKKALTNRPEGLTGSLSIHLCTVQRNGRFYLCRVALCQYMDLASRGQKRLEKCQFYIWVRVKDRPLDDRRQAIGRRRWFGHVS